MSRTALLAVATAAAAALVWFASADLAWPARLMLVFLLAVLPPLVIAQYRLADELPETVPRSAVYATSSGGLWLLAALVLLAAFAAGFTPRLLGLTSPPPLPLAAWAAAATLVGLALMALGRALRIRESRVLRFLLPRSRGERIAFAGLAVSAGVGEELVFRSFLIPALTVATGSTWAAVALSSAVFGVLHAYQNTAGSIRAAVLGLVLAVPFVATGSVLPSIIAHTALDLIAGLWLADWLLRR